MPDNSSKLEIALSKNYLDFIVGVFIVGIKANRPEFTSDRKMWYLEEILLIVRAVWPNLSQDQYQHILNSIVDIAQMEDSDEKPHKFIDKQTEKE